MKDAIRAHILSLGGDLCGFASVDRFEEAPQGFSPKDIWTDCKSLIVFAVALPAGLFKVSPRLVYAHYNTLSCAQVDEISFRAAKFIEQTFQAKAVPLPCDAPYEYWEEERMEGRGLLSMKHAAMHAGLGSIGKNGLFSCQEYGGRVTLGCILCDIALASDKLAPNLCIEGCHCCEEACPTDAITNGVVTQSLCRMHTFGKTARGFATVNCNLCRTICPLNPR